MDMINIVIDVLIEMWWLVLMIVCALAYAAHVDKRYTIETNSYMDEVTSSMNKCQYDKDTF